MKKILVSIFLIASFIGLAFYASASFEAKPKTSFHIALSNSIFLGIDGLDSNIIGYKSSVDISGHLPVANCKMKSKFLGQADDVYFFHIKYEDICTNNVIVLQKDGVNMFSSIHTLKFYNAFKIYNKFTDYPSNSLREVLVDLAKKQKRLQRYKDINSQTATSFLAIQKKRKYDEVTYIHGIISNILESREYPYLIPVKGYKLPVQKSHMPNFSRAYRKGYTDGIHHGWDIFTPKNTPVQALDSGFIVYVKSDFKYGDLKKIKRGAITEMDRLKNLDIHRGNQVWLKTMKGEVVFYSHLASIESGIEVGKFVSKGSTLGAVGVSGIPGKDYSEYHLHFAIQENPYNILKAGKYTLEDYMSWDWLLRGLSMDEVKLKQADIFVK